MSSERKMGRLKVPVSLDRDHIRGPADAPFTLVEYGDFQCPFCSQAHFKLEALRASVGDSVRFVFRHFPLTQIHPYALLGSMAAESAGLQGKFWEMHDMIFENQDSLGPDGVLAFAEELQLDLDEFAENLRNSHLEAKVRTDFQVGMRSGVNGTPSFFLNEVKYEGPLDPQVFQEFLAAS